ncbi:Glucosyl-3-phosphoglycerate/mannosyl-3-phosphoglycerate phosphatase [uncultured archaeon]|nr:Glucosyl-3-phosphoglycerate/mannosyl-3-phosphoglycerate phosphatase [uncultured archaeon]
MKVVFTDLDGTLLENGQGPSDGAKASLAMLRNKKIPVVPVSSKTRAELEYWQRKLGLHGPFISENGAAIFIPKKYFSFKASGAVSAGRLLEIKLSKGVSKPRKFLAEMRKKGFETESLSEMGLQRAMELTGMGRALAAKAKKREFDECFLLHSGSAKELAKIARKKGLIFLMGGGFCHLCIGHDKGKAVKKLAYLYKKEFGQINSIAIGDSENDIAMLAAADDAYLVRKPDGGYASKKFKKAKAKGQKGWIEIIAGILAGPDDAIISCCLPQARQRSI